MNFYKTAKNHDRKQNDSNISHKTTILHPIFFITFLTILSAVFLSLASAAPPFPGGENPPPFPGGENRPPPPLGEEVPMASFTFLSRLFRLSIKKIVIFLKKNYKNN